MEECSYFVGNILVQVRHIFLPDYLLVLTLLKLKGVWGILEQPFMASDYTHITNCLISLVLMLYLISLVFCKPPDILLYLWY